MPQTPAERQAAYRERQRAKNDQDANRELLGKEDQGDSVTGTNKIIAALRAKAERGDVSAARALLEYIEIQKTPERAREKALVEMLSPELRRAIAEELHGEPLPVNWPHQKLEIESVT